jgi:uncharacterized protein (DUF1330 family)
VSLTLCVLLWPRPGQDEALVAYEDEVLALLADHDGRVVHRARTVDTPRLDDEPLEVQLLEFADEASLDRFMADERRVALADQRDRAIERTQVLRVDLT